MLGDDSSLHVLDGGRTICDNDSNGIHSQKNGDKAAVRRNRRKAPGREHPFLPEELVNRILEFALSFGIQVILVGKVGKLIRSNRPIGEMSAYCCVYYLVNNSLQVGLVKYNKGKINIFTGDYCCREKWISTFKATYEATAEEVKYAVLRGAMPPVVVPGLFLKSNGSCSGYR